MNLHQKMKIPRIKKMDKLLYNNQDNKNDINNNKYQHININNSLNNIIYIQNQTTQNLPFQLPIRRQMTKVQPREKSIGNKNHSYLEICNVNERNSHRTSKTIYHDYSNMDKKINNN